MHASNLAVIALLSLGFFSPARAVNLSPDGLGQVLLYPYFTVEKGQQTVLSVVNTTEHGKALKLRFLESYNGREVFGFNLYLSPFDVWVGSVLESANRTDPSLPGPAALRMLDSSCAVPSMLNTAYYIADFHVGQYTGVNNDSGPNDSARTREGHIELFEMGSIAPVKYDGSDFNNLPNGTFFAMGSAFGGAPPGCDAIAQAWKFGNVPLSGSGTVGITLPGLFTSNLAMRYQGTFGEYAIDTRDIAPPTGGLFGSAAIVDATSGTHINYAPEAIEGFQTVANHTSVGDPLPNLTSGSNVSYNVVNGELVVSYWRESAATGSNSDAGSSIDAISSLFQASEIWNEFSSINSLNVQSASEWLVSMPTKRFYVDPRYGAIFSNATSAIAPFRNTFTRTDTSGAIIENNRGFACEVMVVGIRDQEERGPITGGADFIPIPMAPTTIFCFATQVVAINQTADARSAIFAAKPSFNVNTGATAGIIAMISGRLSTASAATIRTMRPSTNGHIFHGLPSIGFWAVRQQNAAQLSGGAFNHKRIRRCLKVNGENCGMQ